MGRWADKNNDEIINAILKLRHDPDEGVRRIQELARDAAKHDKGDAAVMNKLAAGHEHLAG